MVFLKFKAFISYFLRLLIKHPIYRNPSFVNNLDIKPAATIPLPDIKTEEGNILYG